MWVKRDEHEVARWRETTRRDARTHALVVTLFVATFLIVLGPGGWFFSPRAGVVLQRSVVPGGYWRRLAIVFAFGVPFCTWLYRREHRKELAKSSRRTICPTCGRAGEDDPGTACGCGDAVVPLGTMKWVDDA